ncbi:MAG: hypothetical protein ACR2RB_18980 [Gammaproteobacteria bacterium]
MTRRHIALGLGVIFLVIAVQYLLFKFFITPTELVELRAELAQTQAKLAETRCTDAQANWFLLEAANRGLDVWVRLLQIRSAPPVPEQLLLQAAHVAYIGGLLVRSPNSQTEFTLGELYAQREVFKSRLAKRREEAAINWGRYCGEGGPPTIQLGGRF